MTTLKATATARIALERRKLEGRLMAVRGRAEALPQLNLGGLLAGAENRLSLLQFDRCAEMLNDVDSRIEKHQADLTAAEMAAAGQAQDQLLAQRGVETAMDGSTRTRDGWRWLKSRRPPRLSSTQIITGDRFAALWVAANRDTLSTSANDNGSESKVDALDALSAAKAKLGRLARHFDDAMGSERLFDLLANVCGRGETLRALAGGDDRRAAGYEIELKLALDMAAAAFRARDSREEAA